MLVELKNLMNRILTIFLGAHDGLFFKDVFQFPIKVANNENATLDYLSASAVSDELVASYPALTMKKVKKTRLLKSFFPIAKYLLATAKSYDLLILFHVRDYTLIYALLFTKLNPQGKVVIKADRGNLSLQSQGILRKGHIRRLFENFLLESFKSNQLIISYETDKAKNIARTLLPDTIEVIRTYNGHNIPEERETIHFDEKQNVFVIVGMIGDRRKNHRIIIDAIELILNENEDLLKGWSFKFVGKVVNPAFSADIEERAKKFPFFRDAINLLGNKNKSELYNLYDQSKYMIVSSLHEGSPLVIPESLRFGNVILTTPVSSVPELIQESGYVADGFSVNDMKKIIEAAIADAQENKSKSMKAREFGLCLEWKKLEYTNQISS